ncbi:hypothetical protein TNCV_1443281 [Trichonephila clavipes]|nr:hypothetical protein TNCV_1443281 [Trichonephila clavipes]
MVLKANDRRTSCPCHDEFRGPRSDYVRQNWDSSKKCAPPVSRFVARVDAYQGRWKSMLKVHAAARVETGRAAYFLTKNPEWCRSGLLLAYFTLGHYLREILHAFQHNPLISESHHSS